MNGSSLTLICWSLISFLAEIVNLTTDMVQNIDIESSKENNNSPSSQIVHPSAFSLNSCRNSRPENEFFAKKKINKRFVFKEK